MQKSFHKFSNNFMGREFYLWSYGHYGMPVLVFPSAAGMAHEWEAEGMIALLAPLINDGKVKLYCPESNVANTWNNKQAHPADFIKAHQAYEHFIVNEIVPWIYHECHTDTIPLTTTGVSMGAYYAVNHTLKYPHIFKTCFGMSGRYEISSFTHGFMNEDLYFNNPIAYLSNMDGEALDNVRDNSNFVLTCGRGAYESGCLEETIQLGEIMQHKGLDVVCDIWGEDSVHDWNAWKQHTVKHFGHVIGY
jgi:esterase/lipase superfamily enzyme